MLTAATCRDGPTAMAPLPPTSAGGGAYIEPTAPATAAVGTGTQPPSPAPGVSTPTSARHGPAARTVAARTVAAGEITGTARGEGRRRQIWGWWQAFFCHGFLSLT
jgi:hypothetical protein